MAINEFLFAALQYASIGWSVFPVHSVRKGRCSCGKPNCGQIGKHPRIIGWERTATQSPLVIQDWWTKWPDANIGIVTGTPSGIDVLDIDPKNGGDDSFQNLTVKYGKIPETVECLTGGGGRHLYLIDPRRGFRNSASKLAPGLDIRANGGYVVAPPSTHVSGNTYLWEASSDPQNVSPAIMPGWLIKLLQDIQTNAAPTGQSQSQNARTPARKVGKGNRNTKLTSLAGSMRRQGLPQSAIEKALLDYNQQNCYPPLTDQEVLAIARSVSRYSPARPPTDDELAADWLQQNPDIAYGLGEFRRYENGYWSILPYEQAESEIYSVLIGAKPRGINPSLWKKKSVIDCARTQCQVKTEKWDANPDILVCKNGTLEIPTKMIRGHSETDYCTSGLDFDFDPTAKAPTWEKFLKIIPDASDFLQQFAGYCLTTDTTHELAVWLYGPPGCGKSTFIEGLLSMLGNRAGQIGLAEIERSRFSLGNIIGKTLLYATEQPAMFIQASHTINSLISGELVTVDRKFRDAVELRSRAKITWAMNELPRTSEAGSGIFRRVKVVEFPPLEEKHRDPLVKEAIKHEGAGILNWALEGLDALRQDGRFTIPACVRDATSQWQRYNDIPATYLEERIVKDPTISTSASALYLDYRTWCVDNGNKPQSSTSLAMDWKRLGLTKKHTMNGTFYDGIKLKP